MLLRDGKKVIGTLRSFDQFANIVLEEAVERIVVGKQMPACRSGCTSSAARTPY